MYLEEVSYGIKTALYHTKLLFGVSYSLSMHVNYFSTLEHILELNSLNYDLTIETGDLNICLLKNDLRTNKLTSPVSSLNM